MAPCIPGDGRQHEDRHPQSPGAPAGHCDGQGDLPTLLPPPSAAKRNRYIEARIGNRIREPESLPSTVGEGGLELPIDDGKKGVEGKENVSEQPTLDSLMPGKKADLLAKSTPGKLRAVIELKVLSVREKQRALRAQVGEWLAHGTLLMLDRKDFCCPRRLTLQDACTAKALERKQRVERKRKAKAKHLEQLNTICTHGLELLATDRAQQDRMLKLGWSVQALHGCTEETKQIEWIRKECLKALKADDEEVYTVYTTMTSAIISW